jgi:hypothetical protein
MLWIDFAMLDYVSHSMYITRVQVKGSDMNTIGRSRSNRNVVLSLDLRVEFERIILVSFNNVVDRFRCARLCF